jgi:hypothetical protein
LQIKTANKNALKQTMAASKLASRKLRRQAAMAAQEAHSSKLLRQQKRIAAQVRRACLVFHSKVNQCETDVDSVVQLACN